MCVFFFSSRRRHTRSDRDWSSDVCSSDQLQSQAKDGIRDLIVTGVDRKSTRLNSSHDQISYAVFCLDRKSTRLNSSHDQISYAVFCLKKKSTRLNSSHDQISYAVFCLKKKKTKNMTNTYLIQVVKSREKTETRILTETTVSVSTSCNLHLVL